MSELITERSTERVRLDPAARPARKRASTRGKRSTRRPKEPEPTVNSDTNSLFENVATGLGNIKDKLQQRDTAQATPGYVPPNDQYSNAEFSAEEDDVPEDTILNKSVNFILLLVGIFIVIVILMVAYGLLKSDAPLTEADQLTPAPTEATDDSVSYNIDGLTYTG